MTLQHGQEEIDLLGEAWDPYLDLDRVFIQSLINQYSGMQFVGRLGQAVNNRSQFEANRVKYQLLNEDLFAATPKTKDDVHFVHIRVTVNEKSVFKCQQHDQNAIAKPITLNPPKTHNKSPQLPKLVLFASLFHPDSKLFCGRTCQSKPITMKKVGYEMFAAQGTAEFIVAFAKVQDLKQFQIVIDVHTYSQDNQQHPYRQQGCFQAALVDTAAVTQKRLVTGTPRNLFLLQVKQPLELDPKIQFAYAAELISVSDQLESLTRLIPVGLLISGNDEIPGLFTKTLPENFTTYLNVLSQEVCVNFLRFRIIFDRAFEASIKQKVRQRVALMHGTTPISVKISSRRLKIVMHNGLKQLQEQSTHFGSVSKSNDEYRAATICNLAITNYLIDPSVALEYSIIVSFDVEFKEDIFNYEEVICSFIDVPKKNIDPSKANTISDEFFMMSHCVNGLYGRIQLEGIVSTSTTILDHINEHNELNDMNAQNMRKNEQLALAKNDFQRLKIEKQHQQVELKLRLNELMMRVKEIEELKLKQDVRGGISLFDKIKADVRRRKQELEILKDAYYSNVAKYKRLLHIESPSVHVQAVRRVEQKRVEYTSVVRSKKDMAWLQLPVESLIQLSEEVPVDNFRLLTEVEDSLRKNLLNFTITQLMFYQEAVTPQDLKNVLSRQYNVGLKLGIFKSKSIAVEIRQNKIVKWVGEQLMVNCTLENDLVDYFKTFKQGYLEVRIGELNLIGRAAVLQLLRQKKAYTEFLYEIDLFNLGMKVAKINVIVKNTGQFVNQQIIVRSNQPHQESKHVYNSEAAIVAEHGKAQRVAAFKLRQKQIEEENEKDGRATPAVITTTKPSIRTYCHPDPIQPEFIGIPKPAHIPVDVRQGELTFIEIPFTNTEEGERSFNIIFKTGVERVTLDHAVQQVGGIVSVVKDAASLIEQCRVQKQNYAHFKHSSDLFTLNSKETCVVLLAVKSVKQIEKTFLKVRISNGKSKNEFVKDFDYLLVPRFQEMIHRGSLKVIDQKAQLPQELFQTGFTLQSSIGQIIMGQQLLQLKENDVDDEVCIFEYTNTDYLNKQYKFRLLRLQKLQLRGTIDLGEWVQVQNDQIKRQPFLPNEFHADGKHVVFARQGACDVIYGDLLISYQAHHFNISKVIQIQALLGVDCCASTVIRTNFSDTPGNKCRVFASDPDFTLKDQFVPIQTDGIVKIVFNYLCQNTASNDVVLTLVPLQTQQIEDPLVVLVQFKL